MLQINDTVYAEQPLVADEGFQFGRGIYETILIHRRPVFWAEHCQRLNQGLAHLAIDRVVDPAQLLDQVEQLGLMCCVLKVIATAENLVLMTRPIPEALPDPVMRLTLQPDTRSTDLRLLQNKTLSYLPNLLAWQDARRSGFDDVLFFEPGGLIRECSRSNIYIIREQRILTPEDACGLLPGTVRRWLLSEGLVSTGRFTQADILSADCVFASNAVIGIRRVSDLDGHRFNDHLLLQEVIRRYRQQIVEPAQR